MTLLVTGAAGFIGSNFVYHLLAEEPGCRVVGLDKLTYAGNLENLSALPAEHARRFVFVKGDIDDRALLDRLFAEHGFDGLVNFAAESHVDRAIHDAQVFLTTNVLGTHALLEAARRHWKAADGWRENTRFVQVSTDEVYGSLGQQGFFSEQSPLAPRNPYAASKASADHLVQAFHHTFGLPASITRCSNNYGPYQFPEKLIPLMIRNALRHEPLPVYGDGRQVRDWLYVEDHCRAIARVLRAGRPGQVYNIGGHHERENIDLVRSLLAALRQRTGDARIDERLIRHVEDRPGHDRRYAIDASRIEAELGWTPRVAFEQGLERTIGWYLEHRDWTERVISGEYLDFYEKNYAARGQVD
jgi:dTDP-glucose 4,6-dehydratase